MRIDLDKVREDVTVNVTELLKSLRGHVNVLGTHHPEDDHERGRIAGWTEAHRYLEKLVVVFAGLDPEAVKAAGSKGLAALAEGDASGDGPEALAVGS